MKQQVILLNGPSSSGKSTLAKALRKLIDEKRNQQYEIVSIDDFLKMTTEETIYEDDVFGISRALCEKVLERLETAPGVIIDHVITSQRIFEQLKHLLENYLLKTVRVTCPLEILLEREKARKNRCLGSAEASYEYLYPKDGYDLTVDTHRMSTAQCALEIYRSLF